MLRKKEGRKEGRKGLEGREEASKESHNDQHNRNTDNTCSLKCIEVQQPLLIIHNPILV